MQLGIIILLLFLTGLSLATAVYWGIGLVRFMRVARTLPRPSASAPASDVLACVIIPAYNEAANIARLIESLRAQDHPAMRVVLALDRCTDDTHARAVEAIGGDPCFEIVEIDVCPDDWAGKVHAIWRAVRESPHARDADVLLFSDADTVWRPACLRATLELMERRRLDLLSLLCNVHARRWWEWGVQPAAGLELLRQYPLLRSNQPGYARPFVNGQFMMIRREAYQRISGHEAVHAEMLEDLAIGRRAGDAGLRCGVFLAGGMITCRMYESWEEFKGGWTRIFAESARRRVGRLRRASRHVRIAGTLLPASAAACLVVSLLSAEYVPDAIRVGCASAACVALALYIGTIAGALRLGGVPWRAVAAYPFGAWMVGGILARTARLVARGETMHWGGREYRLTAR